MKRKFNFKLFALCSVALAFAACSDDNYTGSTSGDDLTGSSQFNTATFTVQNSLQTRAINTDTWSLTEEEENSHSSHTEINDQTFNVPKDAIDLTTVTLKSNETTEGVFVIPEGQISSINFNNGSISGSLYIKGTLNGGIQDNNIRGNLKIYVCEGASWTTSSVGEGLDVYNAGTLTLTNLTNTKFKNIYNCGQLNVENTTINSGVKIFSNSEGVVYFNNVSQVMCELDIHGTLYTHGNLEIQSANAYVCDLQINNNKLYVNGTGLKATKIVAKEIELNGKEVYLLPNAYVKTEKLSIPNGNGFVGYNNSVAVIEADEFYFRNHNNFEVSFSANIYFKVNSIIDIQERIKRDNGQVDDVTNKYTAESYVVSQNGKAVAGRINNAEITVNPICGAEVEPAPPTPDMTIVPTLIRIGHIEAISDHDHNSDKDANKRKLSATSIDYNNGVFYTSYHMRGSNYANDIYDKDSIEGCIETWTIVDDEEDGVKTKKIQLGQYMWTNAFDFNHLIFDGQNIVTVGHKGGIKDGTEDEHVNLGAIIGKLPNSFVNFDPVEGDRMDFTYSEEFKYKYLTTDEELRGEGKNGTDIRLDYKNAGDGNCVIKVGNEYFVTTYAGYGKLDSNFARIKDNDGNVAFVRTDYSAKHIVKKGDDEVAVLYLNDEPEGDLTYKTESSATIAIINNNSYPFDAVEQHTLKANVTPVDGKNVLAWDGNKFYACLGEGGLQIGDEVFTFGEYDASEENHTAPVNGVAVDDEYIYVAAGSSLHVLDKANPDSENPVASYSHAYNSANYIKVVNIDDVKYIAVAFGQAGIEVFKLVIPETPAE